jgi:hypothetical protein
MWRYSAAETALLHLDNQFIDCRRTIALVAFKVGLLRELQQCRLLLHGEDVHKRHILPPQQGEMLLRWLWQVVLSRAWHACRCGMDKIRGAAASLLRLPCLNKHLGIRYQFSY